MAPPMKASTNSRSVAPATAMPMMARPAAMMMAMVPAPGRARLSVIAAEQPGGGHFCGFGQRPQRKGQRDEDAVGSRTGQRQPLRGQHRRHRQAGGGELHDDPGRRRADGEADGDGGERDEADLPEIDGADGGGIGAERLQRRDGLRLGAEIGPHPARHADTGDDQRGEADERQELAQPVDEAAGAGGAVAAVLELEAGFGGGGLQLRDDGRRRRRRAAA